MNLREQGRNYVGLCPFHEERTPSFLVDEQRGLFKCFGCGEAGTQYLASLPEKIQEAILGNVGSLIAFALSGEDAKILSQEFGPPIHAQYLIDLPAHHCYLKLKIDGVASKPFSAETIPAIPVRVRSSPMGRLDKVLAGGS